MARNFIYSTLTNAQTYTNYTPHVAGQIPVAVEEVTIKGGANLADSHFDTPFGVMTEVTDEQMEILNRNFVFNQHKKAGYITIRTDKVDPEVAVAADMQQKDGSAPHTPNTFAREDLTPVKTVPMNDKNKPKMSMFTGKVAS